MQYPQRFHRLAGVFRCFGEMVSAWPQQISAAFLGHHRGLGQVHLACNAHLPKAKTGQTGGFVVPGIRVLRRG
jgi:hypothetical protein